jgi:DNA repair exonuclease SbcCD ATPase subunit
VATLLKSLIGNGTKERDLTDEMRAVLLEMRQERGQCEALAKSARASVTRAQELGGPIAKALSEMDALAERLLTLEQRLGAFEHIATQYQALDEQAERLGQNQKQSDSRIARSAEESQRIHSMIEQLSQKVDLALSLKDRLDEFLEMERPLERVRGDAEELRAQVDGTTDQLSRLREQQERVLEANKAAWSKMEAFDRRQELLARTVQDGERRVAGIEQTLRGWSDVEQTAEDALRKLGTAKALGDAVAQKMSVFEGQRAAVERAIARAEVLDKAMQQLDAGMRQQQENAASLRALQEKVAGLQSLHESVMQRSRELDELQRAGGEQVQRIRSELTAARDDVRKSVERFDFERSGIESVNERVADLRGALTDFETRFAVLDESTQVVNALDSRTQALNSQLQTLSHELSGLDQEKFKAEGIRRALDEAGRTLLDTNDRIRRIEQARPTIEAALREVEQLRGAQAMVKDSLEQTQLAAGEIARVREEHTETKAWLTRVAEMLGDLKGGVDEVQKHAPIVEFVQKQLHRVNESMSAVESRREFVEELHQRLAELGALGAKLDERGQDLQVRLEAAEQRFIGLAEHAAEAERLGKVMSEVSAGLNQAGQDARALTKKVTAAESRCDSVEALAERMRTLREELDQRQNALEDAASDLERASELRHEAAAAAHELHERASGLAAALSNADEQTTRVATLSLQLEERVAGLRGVEKRVNQFDERLTSFERMEQEISRSLEQLSARQGTIDALKADIDRMFMIAEKTATDVRAITSAQGEIEQSRTSLDDLMDRMREVQETTTLIDQRKRQMDQAEDRLARAEALLIDVRSSIELLRGQKVIVDHAVEKAGALRLLLKQAEAMIEELRDERDVTTRVRAAVATPANAESDEQDLDTAVSTPAEAETDQNDGDDTPSSMSCATEDEPE